MKKLIITFILGSVALLTLAACGGGGGGGGAVKTSTKLYLYGNTSSNYYVNHVTTSIYVPNLTSLDYLPSTTEIATLRDGVIQASGQVFPPSIDASYNTTSKILKIEITMNTNSTISINSVTGTEIATLTTTGATIPSSDPNPIVGEFTLVPSYGTRALTGCSVTYGP